MDDSDYSDADDQDHDSIPSPPFSPLSFVDHGQRLEQITDFPVTSSSDEDFSHDDDIEAVSLEDTSDIDFEPASGNNSGYDVEREQRFCYKIVGDNIDKNVRRSFQRVDATTKSLHCFHSYAVRDRVNTAGMSREPQTRTVCPQSILPSEVDEKRLMDDFEVLVSR